MEAPDEKPSECAAMFRVVHADRISLAACLAAFSLSAASAQTPAAPQTFWNWMGIPKEPLSGLVNREGNFPMCEKKPKLLRIADPQNLESKNPAIKKAAEIKAEEDLAAQKIKAIKYLGEIGCQDCYEGVDDALLAALDDCTEAVRYEAVKVILQRALCDANNPCLEKCMNKTKTCKEHCTDVKVGLMKSMCAKMHLLCGKPGPDGVTIKSKLPGFACGMAKADSNCGKCGCRGSCCSDKMTKKLVDLAYDRDEHGCYKEPSPRVRAMALQAIKACNPNPRPMMAEPVVADEEIAAPVPDKESAKPQSKEQAAPAKENGAGESLPEASVLAPAETELTANEPTGELPIASVVGDGLETLPGFSVVTPFAVGEAERATAEAAVIGEASAEVAAVAGEAVALPSVEPEPAASITDVAAEEMRLEESAVALSVASETEPVEELTPVEEVAAADPVSVAPAEPVDPVAAPAETPRSTLAKRFSQYASSDWREPEQPRTQQQVAVIGPSGIRQRLERWQGTDVRR